METVHTSIYSMLMTVLFYTTASICALRAAAWLSVHTLLPALSRIVSHYYNYYYSHADDPARHIPSSSSQRPPPLGDSSGQPGSAAAETLFKRVRTAAGHHRFIPVSIAGPHHVVTAADSTASAQTTLLRLRGIAMLVLISVSVAGILARYYPHFTAMINRARRSINRSNSRTGLTAPSEPSSNAPRIPSGPTGPQALNSTTHAALDLMKKSSPDSGAPAFKTRTRLNPAAPVFTPLPTHRLDPTVRAFAPATRVSRGNDSAPASPADSAGPATPSPVRNAFAFAFAARAARGKGSADGSPLPLGVGKMRVVRPEDVVVGERRAGEVFVFF